MATQGLVTVTQNNRVVMKIVAGCDGMNAPKLAKAIEALGRVPSLSEAYEMALKAGFGDSRCLVVMDQKRSKHDTEAPLSRLYRRTFSQPDFNPRWKHGTADFTNRVSL